MLYQPELGTWCGPSALSILTNEPYPKTTSLLAFIRDQPYSEVEGVYTEEVILGLYNLGYTATRVDLPRLMTLKRYMRGRTTAQKVEPMLITLYKHFVVAHYDYLSDNWVKKPTPYTQFPKTGRLITDAHIIRKRIS